MSTPGPVDIAPRRGWLIPALVVSLGLNLLVAGVAGGTLLQRVPATGHKPAPPVTAFGLRPYFRFLDAEDRSALLAALKARRGELRDLAPLGRRHLLAFARVLAAEPFEEAALADLLRQRGETAVRRLEIGHAELLSRVTAMTDEDRRALAQDIRAAAKALSQKKKKRLRPRK